MTMSMDCRGLRRLVLAGLLAGAGLHVDAYPVDHPGLFPRERMGSSLSQIAHGDKLGQRLSYQKVGDRFTSTCEQRVVHLTLDNGQTTEVTDGHPFKTTDGWRDAILLKKGGKLLLKGSGDADSDGKRAAGRSGV